jgi:hypothetical protein
MPVLPKRPSSAHYPIFILYFFVIAASFIIAIITNDPLAAGFGLAAGSK